MNSIVQSVRGLDTKMNNCKSTVEFGGMMRIKRGIKQKSQRSQIANSYTNIQHSNKKAPAETETKLEPTRGKLNGHMVTTLRDSGCSTVCVDKRLVKPEQLTGIYKACKLMDGTSKTFETATVALDTPYIKDDRILVMCIDDLEFGIVIGDIPGARCKCNPDPNGR